MTTINELFRRPIERSINGVIKVGQQDHENVMQELDEYVVTRELDGEFRKFFRHYASSLDQPTDRVGVWISGFFGSGKSHFLKILSYLLENRGVGETHAAAFFDDVKVPDPMLRAEIDKVARAAPHADVILFNIDAKADSSSKSQKEAIAKVMLKALDEHLGYLASSPELAAFERMLDKRGRYQAFQQAFEQAAGASWPAVRDGWAFHQPEITQALGVAAGMGEEEARRWLESLTTRRDVSAEEFAREVREYLDRRGPQHRVLFLVDEVGQYVGDNSSLMLNLQSVAEELGTRAPGRAWILVTSQEDIDTVLAGRGSSNDFSKIQGRFNTRISLSSANTDEVIRRRLLAKTDDGTAALQALFDGAQATLKHLVTFRNDVALSGYTRPEDFVANYPFVPYQFFLLQKAFTAIRQTGHAGKHLAEGERSMLNAFQDAALAYGSRPLGTLVPFDAFYRAVEGFLDSGVRRVIDQARDNGALEAHDIDLLKTLFMLKHVKEIKTNTENLVILSLTGVDEDTLALRTRLEASLGRLEKQTLIARSGETWEFLTNEEQDVGREIKSVDVAAGELNSQLQKRIWDSIYPLSALKYDPYHPYKFTQKLDDRLYGAGGHDIGLHVITPYSDRYEELQDENLAALQTGGGTEALVVLPDDQALFEELTEMVRTEKYVQRRAGQEKSTRMADIIRARQDENAQRKNRIETNLRDAIARARVYASGARVATGGGPQEVLSTALRTLVDNGYSKLKYVAKPHLTEGDVTRAFTTPDDSQTLEGQDPNHLALGDLERWLGEQALRSVRVTVRALLDVYTRRPYGWSEAEALGILATLVAQGKAELHRAQKAVDPGEAGLAGKLLKRAGQEETVVRLSDAIDPRALATARKLAREYVPDLDRAAAAEAPRLVAGFRAQVQRDQADLARYQERAAQGYPFGPLLDAPKTLLDDLGRADGTAAFLGALQTRAKALEDWIDLRSRLSGFYSGSQVAIYEEVRRHLAELEPDLTRVNVPELQERVKQARDMLAMPDPARVLPRMAGLLKPVRARVEELLAESMGRVREVLEAETQRLQDIARELGPDKTRTLTGPILAVRERLERAATIDAAEATELHVQQAAHRVEQDILKAINDRARTPVHDDTPVDVPVTKPIRSVRVKTLVTGAYLESTPDIEAFLTRLRTQLTEAVDAGERVRIE